jgi:hypothetical protein
MDWKLPARLQSALIASVVVLAAGPALAYDFNGDWCHRDGRKMSIHIPEIVLPSGNKVLGIFDDDRFVYVIPDGEPGAGQVVLMVWVDEEPGKPIPPHVWVKCAPPAVSALPDSAHGPS